MRKSWIPARISTKPAVKSHTPQKAVERPNGRSTAFCVIPRGRLHLTATASPKDRPARHTPRPARPPAPSARPGCRANPAGRQPPPPNATRPTPLPTPDDGTLTAPPPPAPRAATVPIPSRGGTHPPGPVCAANGLRRSHVPRPARPRAARAFIIRFILFHIHFVSRKFPICRVPASSATSPCPRACA